MTTVTFSSSGIFSVTSSISAQIKVWGAGEHGFSNGNGGSGGAFASSSIALTANWGYPVIVGASSGATSSFGTASAANYVSAAGGASSGSFINGVFVNVVSASQATFTTGSIKTSGSAGQVYSSNPFSPVGSPGAFGGSGGQPTGSNQVYLGGSGGSGSYYYHGPGTGYIHAAIGGSTPGGGGGGAWQYVSQSSYPYMGNTFFPITNAELITSVFAGVLNQPSGSGQIITASNVLVNGPTTPADNSAPGGGGQVVITF